MPSTQSSTASPGTANRANDGNTDGNFADGSVSHTNLENQPWWQVDLGSSQQITSVKVWNRTDCCSSRTSNFNVIVSDQPITTVGYIYDAAGNVTFDGVHSYTYDAENRLVSVDNGINAKYYYDFGNRRVKKVTAAGTTHYVWEGGKALSEHDGNTGSVLVDYIYSGTTLIAKVASGVTTYFIEDRLSIRMSLDSSGNLTGRQAHGPFGGEFAESGQQDKHHFTSYESDTESALDYALNRFYSVSVGRFMSADPYKQSGYLVDPQSWNRYSYARNKPIDRTDTTGLHDGNWSDGKGNGGPWDCTNCGGNDISPDTTNDVAGTGVGGNKHGSLGDSQNPPTIPPIFFDAARLGQLQQLRASFKSFIDTMSSDCKTALANALDALKSKISTVNFFDLDYHGLGSQTASNWVGNSLPAPNTPLPNETLTAWFGRVAAGEDAVTVFGSKVPFSGGIFYHGSQVNFGNDMYLLLHEMLHYVYQTNDAGLAVTLGVAPKPAANGKPAETAADAVSRYINSGCDPAEK
jgi:RHS repeat-associated protein